MEAGWVAATPATLVATPTAATLIATLTPRFLPDSGHSDILPAWRSKRPLTGIVREVAWPPTGRFRRDSRLQLPQQRRCADVVVDGEGDSDLGVGVAGTYRHRFPELDRSAVLDDRAIRGCGDVRVRCHHFVDRVPVGRVRDVLEDVDIRATQGKRRNSGVRVQRIAPAIAAI